MKTKLIIIVLFGSFLIAHQAVAQRTKKIAFRISGIPQNATNIKPFLRIDTAQALSNNGLRFSVELVNNDASPITIKNPLDGFDITLRNTAGKNILAGETSRNADIHKPAGYKYRYTSFAIEKVTQNGAVLAVDLNDATEITLPAKAKYEIFLAVKDDNHGENKKEIPAGKYELSIGLFLRCDSKKRDFFAIYLPILYGR